LALSRNKEKKMNKLLKSLLITTSAPLISFAGINVDWSIGYGVYPSGTVDLTDATAGSGFLAGGGSSLMQLIWTPSATVGVATTADGDFVSGDNVLLASRTITEGVGGYDEWGYNATIPAPFIDATFSPGSVFMRVFQDASPDFGDIYFDSALLTLEDRGSDPVADTQVLYLETGSDTYPSQGVALNGSLTVVPEPSVIAFLGLGGLALAARRRIVV